MVFLDRGDMATAHAARDYLQGRVPMQLSDYLEVLRRRRRQAIVPALVVLLGAVLLAYLLPPVYRSAATIVIEQQEVPEELVRTTITSYAVERIQIISKRVMTRENLLPIIDKFGLYRDERQSGDVDDAVRQMRKSIKVEVISADVSDPQKGIKDVLAAIAFELSFEARTPEVAEGVAKELLALFLAENRRIRIQKAEGATGFLSEEAQRLAERISYLEEHLATYKEKNTGKLPELMNMNMSLMEQTQRELENLDRAIVSLEERRVLLQGQLASVEPYSGTGPGGRLKELQSQYVAAVAVYSPDHPDVTRLKREIELLRKETGLNEEQEAVESELKRVRADLDRLRNTYAADHPDVVRLTKRRALLEEKLRASSRSSALGVALRPDNPAYIALKTQLDTVELSLKATREQQTRAREKLTDYEMRIVQTPRIEQEGLTLRREYENAVAKFKEIRDKQLHAEVAEQLEKESKGERFSVVEPPNRPTAPAKPNRLGILLLGVMLAGGVGVGNAAYAEHRDQSIRGARAIVTILQSPPLAVIPYIANGQEAYGNGGRVGEAYGA